MDAQDISDAAEAAPAEEPVTLLDLEPDVLLLCLEHVGARGLGRVATVNKFFSILCAEHASHAPFLASTVAACLGAAHAALESQCAAAPSVGLFFSSEPLVQASGSKTTFSKELKKMASALPPAAHVVGCNTHRIVTTQRDAVESGGTDKTVALQLGRFPEATVSAVAVITHSNGAVRAPLGRQLIGCARPLGRLARSCSVSTSCTSHARSRPRWRRRSASRSASRSARRRWTA